MISFRQNRLTASVTRLARARKGGIALLAATLFPAMLGVALLGVDGSRVHYNSLLLRQTAQNAALAGANKITTYYTSGNNSTSTVVSYAQQFSASNMPSSTFGTVVPASSVVLGNWNSADKVFTPLAGVGTPNAVKVTAALSSANGNPFQTLFGGAFGIGTKNLTASAIASYATGKAFNVLVINDLSGSFSPSIANQRAADQAILDCVKTSAGATSVYGIVGFTGYGQSTQPPVTAIANYATLTTKIASINSCGGVGAPACSGSNVAGGIYHATKSDMFGSAAYAGTNLNIVVITDGVPNVNNSHDYQTSSGIYPDPTSTTPVCQGKVSTVGNPNPCTNAKLLEMAQNQATYADSLGINVSTIYYAGGTPAAQQASYAASLATLRKGMGISMTVPTQAQINSSFQAFCATMSSKLMAMY